MASASCSVVALIWTLTVVQLASHYKAGAAASLNCFMIVSDELADCLNYVEMHGSETYPSDSCCSGLKYVVETNADCLCDAFNQSPIPLNITRATNLPIDCKVQGSPSTSKCGAKSSDSAPAPSPEVPSPGGVAPAHGGGGISPGPASGSSSSLAISFVTLILGVLAAASVSLL